MPKWIIALVGLGAVLIFVGIILLIGAVLSVVKMRSFSKCSKSVTGTVENKYVHHGNNRRYYSMTIRYTVDTMTYERSVPADSSEYDTLRAGDPFEIRYRPDKPKKITRADSISEQNRKKMRTLLVTSVVMTVLGIVLVCIRFFAV